ncbi:hypothetical protein HAZT_HAZT008142 [Hyalella azteca]|uniref:Ig-like domain-containing protein n=1 Tax=Hyalella azteca TaxID=294128 RepID=A0A6A0GXA0_HYAAZ|nr:hypothetical protein HAZT_HAZT008142 [Hyalella azteca]
MLEPSNVVLALFCSVVFTLGMQLPLTHANNSYSRYGVQLPATHHQRVHVNGTLTIAAVTREGDEGSYSCTALDKQGRSDHQTLHIQVMGLPAQATCIVLSGDPPITLRWLKDGQAITAAASGVLISQHSEISSTLSIDRTSGEHSGNYTCTASNGARTTSSSAALTINSALFFDFATSDNLI